MPQNATLIVAGRFNPQSVLSLAQKYFGDLPSHPSPERPALPSWQPRSVALEMKALVSRDVVVVAWPAPAVGQPEDAALDLAAAVLTDPQGRLQAELARTGLVTQVGSRESSAARASLFTVSATIADGKSAEEVLRSIRESVRRVGESVTEQECARAPPEWTDLLLQRLETSNGRASRLRASPTGQPGPLGRAQVRRNRSGRRRGGSAAGPRRAAGNHRGATKSQRAEAWCRRAPPRGDPVRPVLAALLLGLCTCAAPLERPLSTRTSICAGRGRRPRAVPENAPFRAVAPPLELHASSPVPKVESFTLDNGSAASWWSDEASRSSSRIS